MRVKLALAAVAGLLGPAIALAQGRKTDCESTLVGRVVDADLDEPIAGAVVVGDEATVTTDTAGRFEVTGLCPGEVTLTVSKSGFAPSRTTVTVPRARPLEVRLGFAMQSVTITAPVADPLSDLGFTDALEGAELTEVRGLSLSDALDRTAGVQVLRSGAVSKPVIDGFYGNRILILNDGLRHHAQLWGLEHAPEIDPFRADRITVVRGAEGVRYGADAIGGIVLIEPAPFIEPGAPGLNGEGHVVGISNGRQGIANLRLVTTVPGAPRWSARAQGSVKKAGSLDAPDYPLDNTASEEFAGSGAVRYLGRGWQAQISGSHFFSRYGVFSGLQARGLSDFEDAIAQPLPRNVELFEFSYEIEKAFTRVGHTDVRGDVQADIGEWGTLRLRYGYQNNDRREFEIPRSDATRAELRFLLDSHVSELTLEHRFSDRFVGLVGVSGLYQENDYNGSRRLIPDYQRWVGGVFGLERYRGDDFELAIGLRYERQALDTVQPAAIQPELNPLERFSLDFEAMMATVGLSWTPEPAWRFDLHLASATRIPTVDELFLDGLLPAEVYVVKGDRGLEPEKTINLGLGIALSEAWIDAEVTAYVHRIADYIYRAPVLGADGRPEFARGVSGRFPRLEYRNVDALYAGGTVVLTLRPYDGFELKSQASYVRARNLSDGTFLINIPPDRYENRLTYRPPTLGPIRAPKVWVESIAVLMQGEFDPNADFDAPPPGYHLLNAGLGATFDVGPQEVRASLDLQNITNAAYRDYLSRLRFFGDEAGFSAILRLTLPFEAKFGGGQQE